jgi:hypothetical protein
MNVGKRHSPYCIGPYRSLLLPALELAAVIFCTVFVSGSSAGEIRSGAHHKVQVAVQTERNLKEQIASEVGRADCDHSNQCRTQAVGWKECGGPAAWVAWSQKTTNLARLEVLAEKLANVQRRQPVPGGGQSNCQYLPDPGAICAVGHCVLRISGASNQ